MAHERNHDYHIVDPSPWPFIGAVGAFVMLLGAVLFFKGFGPWLLLIGSAITMYVAYAWWSDVVDEAIEGDHKPIVQTGLRFGIVLFIVSEVMFFSAWFWTFFKHAIFPMDAIGNQWPPPGIETFNPWHLPLINTLILLCSGCAATWAHHAIAHDNNRKDLVNGLILAVALGVLFTVFQAYEYSTAAFGFAGNIYGASFFMATGFHGVHVIIGTIFLSVCLLRAMRGHFTQQQHVGIEAAAWYWHFVDVVWLFLFAAIYIWGSSGG